MEQLEQYKTLTSDIRKKIYVLLTETDELRPTELAESCKKSNSTVTYHLDVLRNAGLVVQKRVGNHMFYSLHPNEKKKRKEIEVKPMMSIKDKVFQKVRDLAEELDAEVSNGGDSAWDVGRLFIHRHDELVMDFEYSFMLSAFTALCRKPVDGQAKIYSYEDKDIQSFCEYVRKQLTIENDHLSDSNEEIDKVMNTILEEVHKQFHFYAFLTEDRTLQEEVEAFIAERVNDFSHLIPSKERPAFIERVAQFSMGFGPLQVWCEAPVVKKIQVIGPKKVFVEYKNGVEQTENVFRNNKELLFLMRRLIEYTDYTRNRVEYSASYSSMTIKNKYRVHVVKSNISADGHHLTIEKIDNTSHDLFTLEKDGVLTKGMVETLQEAIKADKNIVVTGLTGSGTHRILQAIAHHIPKEEHLATVEDYRTLIVPHDYQSRFSPLESTYAQPNTLQDCLQAAILIQPDRILLKECTNETVAALFDSRRNACRSFLTTVQARSFDDAISCLHSMYPCAYPNLSRQYVQKFIASLTDIIVEVEDGRIRQIISCVYDESDNRTVFEIMNENPTH